MANWNDSSRLLERLIRVRSVDDLLREVGLRRSGRLASMASFLGGFALGAGAGMLLAPASGEQSRRFLRGQLRELREMLREVRDSEPQLEIASETTRSQKSPRRPTSKARSSNKPNGRKRPGRATASP